MFDYESDTARHTYELGDVVTKESEDGIEIGVVIQLHEHGDFRTDMFGNASPSEVTMSTIEEIIEFRDELLPEMFEMNERQTKAVSFMKELMEKRRNRTFDYVHGLYIQHNIAFAPNQSSVIMLSAEMFSQSRSLSAAESHILDLTFNQMLKTKPTLPGRK